MTLATPQPSLAFEDRLNQVADTAGPRGATPSGARNIIANKLVGAQHTAQRAVLGVVPLLQKFRRPPIVVLPLVLILLLVLAWGCSHVVESFVIFPTAQLTGSGVIQADEYIVATEAAGRVIELNADEGDSVKAGQALAKLDAVLLTAQVDQAEAALAAAEANLAKLQVGARPEELRQAQAALAQAIAKRDGTKAALDDAQALRANPQDLNLRINAARAALDAAEHRARALNLIAQGATLERAFFERAIDTLEQGITIQTPFGVISKTFSPQRIEELSQQGGLAASKEWSTWAAQSAAFAQRDGARADLDNLLSQQGDPLVLNAQVDAARAQFDAAQAAVKVAQAKLDAQSGGTRPELIGAAQAQVAQAQAVRNSLKAQLDKMTLTAPHDGLVSERLLHLGEMAAPGSALFHVINLDQVTLTIYAPEDQVGRVQVGARADVTVDSFPGRVFAGVVSFISPQAEFTPKNIATKDQRTSQVFAVKITIDNLADLAGPAVPGGHALKPGMPADAAIR